MASFKGLEPDRQLTTGSGLATRFVDESRSNHRGRSQRLLSVPVWLRGGIGKVGRYRRRARVSVLRFGTPVQRIATERRELVDNCSARRQRVSARCSTLLQIRHLLFAPHQSHRESLSNAWIPRNRTSVAVWSAGKCQQFICCVVDALGSGTGRSRDLSPGPCQLRHSN